MCVLVVGVEVVVKTVLMIHNMHVLTPVLSGEP